MERITENVFVCLFVCLAEEMETPPNAQANGFGLFGDFLLNSH